MTTPGGMPRLLHEPAQHPGGALVISRWACTPADAGHDGGGDLEVSRYSGRFQGEMSPATPTGCLLEMFTTPAPPIAWVDCLASSATHMRKLSEVVSGLGNHLPGDDRLPWSKDSALARALGPCR